MKDEKILKSEQLSNEDLEKVAGGTISELEDLTSAMLEKWSALEGIGMAAVHVPGANHALAAEIESLLRNKLGIEADIDLGWGGTGIGSDPNTYKEISTGRKLSHDEVVSRIRKADKYI